mgnify:CR=1 FL=1
MPKIGWQSDLHGKMNLIYENDFQKQSARHSSPLVGTYELYLLCNAVHWGVMQFKM